MKSFKFVQVLVFAIMLVFVSACTPEQIMPSGKGEWTYSNTVTTVNSLTGTTSGTETGDITFNDGNSGKWTPSGGSASDFTWSYNADNKQMTITEGSNAVVYEVVTSKSGSQTWKNVSTSTIIGVTITVTQDITLTKK